MDSNHGPSTNPLIKLEVIGGAPGLGMFMWADGAPFEWLLLHNQLFDFPPGFDPIPPGTTSSVLSNMTVPSVGR